MYSYNKSTAKCKFCFYSVNESSDLPTATKTNYIETSPYLNTPSLKSPNRIQAKMQGVRESIGSMINEMSQKKDHNNQAIERVKSVNADAMGWLREQGDYATYTPKKSDRTYNARENRTIGGVPHYDDYQNAQNFNQGFSTQFNLQGDDQNLVSPVPQFKSLEQENYELRKALNEQIRMNNELLKRINHLETENYDLKVQLGHPESKLRSTRYASVSYDDGNNEFSPIQRYPSAATAKLGGAGGNARSSLNLPAQNSQRYGNDYERGGYANLSSGGNWNDINNQASLLFSDLDKLKR